VCHSVFNVCLLVFGATLYVVHVAVAQAVLNGTWTRRDPMRRTHKTRVLTRVLGKIANETWTLHKLMPRIDRQEDCMQFLAHRRLLSERGRLPRVRTACQLR